MTQAPASSSTRRPFSILLLADDDKTHANTVLDHINAFLHLSRHDVRLYNPRKVRESTLLDLDEFDVVIIHYSITIVSDGYLSPAFREQIKRFKGLKGMFIQDEYRWVDKITAMMCTLGIHVLFTVVPEAAIPKLYGDDRLPNVIKVPTLTGYVPDHLVGHPVSPLAERPLDVGYRGRSLPYWLGTLSQEKGWIGQEFLKRAPQYGLMVDIGWKEEDRLYGQDWINFIASCKATLVTESGATITDFDSSIEAQTLAYLDEHPDAPFAEVFDAILKPYEGNVHIVAISPRVFEAVVLRTALVMFPGHYSGVVRPHEHYILLEKDFSNMAEVVARLRDLDGLQAMTDRAYRDIVASGRYTHRAFIRQFDAVIDDHAWRHGKRRKWRYRLALVERKWTPSGLRHSKIVTRIFYTANTAARKLALLLLTIRLLLGTRFTRRLLGQYLRRPGQWGKTPARRLVADLFRLAILRRLQTNAIRPCFAMTTTYDRAQGKVVIQSWPTEEAQDNDPAQWAEIETALRAGHIREMSWDHLLVAHHMDYPLWGFLFRVYINQGTPYHFEAMLQCCAASERP